MTITVPKEIKDIINGLKYNVDFTGRSSDIVITFEKKYILKMSLDIDLLKREYDINEWFKDKIPCAKNIAFVIENEYAYYLRTYLDGYSLIDKRYLDDPNLLINALTKTMKILRKLNKYDCSQYKAIESEGNSFIHGDLCLPNIYFDEKNNFIGFIDLGGSGLGDEWYDYAWMLWSLEYNLKTDKYNKILLYRLKIKEDKEKYNKYIPLENRDMLIRGKRDLIDKYKR